MALNGSSFLKFARQVVVGVVGGTLVLIGIVMLVLPGPAFIVIPLGLGVLAAEFAWARHLLEHVKREGRRAFGPRLDKLFARFEKREAKRHPPGGEKKKAAR